MTLTAITLLTVGKSYNLFLSESAQDDNDVPIKEKKNSKISYKVKVKTEICKYWAIEGYCPYGKQVFIIYIISVPLLTENTKSEKKCMFPPIIKPRRVKTTLKMGINSYLFQLLLLWGKMSIQTSRKENK